MRTCQNFTNIKFHEDTKLHKGTKLHECKKLHENTIAQRKICKSVKNARVDKIALKQFAPTVNFARDTNLHGGSFLHENKQNIYIHIKTEK